MSLKDLLGEELYNQVTQKLGDKKIDVVNDGRWIPKEKFDETLSEAKQYKEQVKERDGQLEELKKQVKSNEELTARITELQNQNQKTAEEYESKLQTQRFSFAVEQALAKAEAKNVKAVKALLDLEKIKLDGETLLGLEEQVKALKEVEPYLFGVDLHGRRPNPTNTPPPPQDNPWKPETFNLTKQGKILREDPELAKQLKQAAGKS